MAVQHNSYHMKRMSSLLKDKIEKENSTRDSEYLISIENLKSELVKNIDSFETLNLETEFEYDEELELKQLQMRKIKKVLGIRPTMSLKASKVLDMP
eukprot:Pgem_evm1s12208